MRSTPEPSGPFNFRPGAPAPAPAPQKQAEHVTGNIWRQPDGKLETRDHPLPKAESLDDWARGLGI